MTKNSFVVEVTFNLSIYYTWKNIKSAYNNRFKICAPTWIDEFDLLDGLYSVSDIQDYFEYIIKKQTIIDNLPIQMYINKIKNHVVFKIKTSYKLELLSKKMMKLLGSTEKVIDNDKNGENVPKLKIVDAILMHCNVVSNNYQQALQVLFTMVTDNQFGQLITIAPQTLTILKTTNSEFSFIEVWFTDQNNRPLEIEDNVNITLIIGQTL